MEYYYSFAGITFCVMTPDGSMHSPNGDLAAFLVEKQTADYTYEFQMKDSLSDPEGDCLFQDGNTLVYGCEAREIRYKGPISHGPQGAYLRIERQGRRSLVQVKKQELRGGIASKLVLNAMEAEHAIVQNRGFLLHASYICWDDKAILFTAPSETGKSTQAELWCRLRGAELINGDRAAVIMRDGAAQAHGVPFSGSSGVCKQRVLPVAAIVYLAQAPETTIQRIAGINAFKRIWEGCSVNIWSKEDADACVQTVMECVEQVPVFYLACRPDESAVLALEKALKDGR